MSSTVTHQDSESSERSPEAPQDVEAARASMAPNAPAPDEDFGPIEPVVRHQARMALGAALGLKAEDVVVVDVRGRTSYCDLFVLATGAQARQVRAIADTVSHAAKAERGTPPGVEGTVAGRWALVDLGDVLLHVFDGPMRGYYDLDGLWADAPRLPYSTFGFDDDGRDLEADDGGAL
jgi:ribosome-associated protein